ncbi:unnamed protein product [Somion occarium]|uniref:SH3 domain-containing protein n=1 Tax=Somion occarium TaxID=3059160 RepID=A0ABP1CUU0_9APHY
MQVTVEQTIRRPVRQDTFDLRDQIVSDDHLHYGQSHMDNTYPSDEEHSVLEDDSDGEDRDDFMEDDDGSSSLSIPNESINFDLVYALHSFAATVEGQANVVKGDSLILMDDSNSYWWLVRVLKTEEVGYIPAENIETPFERLARLNKHRNVDLAQATQAEKEEVRDRLRENLSSRAGSNQATPSPTPAAANIRPVSRTRSRHVRGVSFTAALSVHRYPPAVWNEEEEEEEEDVEWDDEGYEDEDPGLAEEQELERRFAEDTAGLPQGMEPDDGMSWEDGAVEDMQAKQLQLQQQQRAADVDKDERRDPQPQAPPSPGQDIAAAQKQRVAIIPDDPISTSPTSPKTKDPIQATETKKLSLTPAVARDTPSAERQQTQPQPPGPLLPSAIMQQQHEDRKRTREEIEALEDAQRKKANKGKGPAGSGYNSAPEQSRPPGGAKLRKERDRDVAATDDESNKDKKKKSGGGVFGGLFGRRKDKGKDKAPSSGVSESSSTISVGSSDIILRGSEESGKSSNQQHTTVADPGSPVTASARQQQQLAMAQQALVTTPERVSQRPTEITTPPSAIAQLSQHASQLRQRDQQQQALYQQYLNRSPSSPPEAQPSYGLQSASAVFQGPSSYSNSNNGLGVGTPRQRPGSLVLSPTAMDAQGVGLPDLSVVRIFAGNNLQTEATFKTVLLNSSTTASDLVRQAIQRFRIPGAENESDYYLTIKQVEGSSAALRPDEKPLVVFESLVEAALELPKVKRSSVGSISSVASNLSMHPAIKKLSMNDFTDDSAVKFYLNRKGDEHHDDLGDEGDVTLLAESAHDDDSDSRRSSGPFLSVTTALVIRPEDLPDDMVFDPLTEAIVFKNTLRDRPKPPASSRISQTERRKIFTFPKNVTVAEVIELGLERFGILDGVVDGGDEIEDKLSKRRSSSRVRYGLHVDVGGKERELSPSTRVIDAFPRPPTFRVPDRRDLKRRSADSAQLLGSVEDVSPDDPVFILRRATTYKPSRNRSSAPLDELALSHLHRESTGSASVTSDSTAGLDEPKQRQMSKQEIIAAQRAATRANQRAILSAQANSARGLDVLLPGNAMIRSSRYDVDDRMRYSYVEPDGETYDISDIVEEEWRNEMHRERNGPARDDLLHGVLSRGKDGLGARLDRVLSKIRREGGPVRAALPQATSASTVDSADSMRSRSPSVYSTAEGGPDGPNSRSATPNANAINSRSPTAATHAIAQRMTSPPPRSASVNANIEPDTRSRSRTGTGTPSHQKNPSVTGSAGRRTPAREERRRVYLPADDFGISHMMAVITMRGKLQLGQRQALPPLDPVDELLFGREIKPETLHPKIQEIYSPAFKQLEEMDNALDDLLAEITHKR